MKRKALFVGVNTYEDEQIRDLDFSLSDAHALKTMFELFGFESDILENPNKSDVFHAVRQMTADLGTGDLFFFYFAGHGWTTTSGKHLLFCSDDMYEDLRDDDAGISFDKLKRKTNGDYNRAFVLDACRSDFITGTRGGDTTTRDLRPIGELVKDASVKSSLAVLRSCSQYEHALEIRSRKHGLFTLAMMEVLRSSKDCGRELLFGESLCDAVTDKMLYIAKAEGITAEQTPEFAKTGLAQVLIRGCKTPVPPVVATTGDAQGCVACPICGKHNDVKDTFRCPVCGVDHICLSHQSKEDFCCPSCAEKKAAEKLEARLKEADRFYEDGQFVKSVALYEQCATDGSAHAQYRLGECYHNGNGVAEDWLEAAKWYRMAANQRNSQAQFELAIGYITSWTAGESVEVDGSELGGDALKKEALRLIHEAASSGLASAQCELGAWYCGGDYFDADKVKGVELYRKAAEQGDAEAQFRLGACYEKGVVVEQNIDEALKWYRCACENGYDDARLVLFDMYAKGCGDERDAEEAVEYHRDLAERGSADAQFCLGLMYAYGRGVEKDEESAMDWFQKAEEQEDDEVLLKLSRLYETGDGVKCDINKAFDLCKRAAEQEVENAEAQCRLGRMYEDGRGVSKNYVEAAKWYRRAAEQGNAAAQFNLGLMYSLGQGVEKDEVEAGKWCQLAAAQGQDVVRRELDRSAK